MFGGGYFIAMCLTWGVCVDSMCGLMLYGWVHVGVYLCCVWGDILALGVCSGNLTVRFDNE